MTATAPTIHMNGTSAKDLIEELWAAGTSLSKTIELLQNACPNQRDYYVVAGAWERVTAEHAARMERLRSVYEELESIIDAVSDQQMERESRGGGAR